MKPSVSIRKTSTLGPLDERLRKLERKDVLVGIPQANASRKDGKINNAELLYILSRGSVLQKIPARPVLEPAIQAADNKRNISAELKLAAQGVLEGRPEEASRHLELAGQVGENAAKRWFTDPRNAWQANAPSTIKAKGSDRPMIDTGELRRAITHVVEEKS
jgi:hypothetical protein